MNNHFQNRLFLNVQAIGRNMNTYFLKYFMNTCFLNNLMNTFFLKLNKLEFLERNFVRNK